MAAHHSRFRETCWTGAGSGVKDAAVADDPQQLTRSLERALDALRKSRRTDVALERHPPRQGPAAIALGAFALALFVLGLATGQHWLIYVALAAVAAGGLLLAGGQARRRVGNTAHPQVGMGATIAADAVLEPGARVEMGASVGARALVRGHAVVRMGASVGDGAVLEHGALVSWGASVQDGAVVEEGATVGAGSDVLRGARVPAGMWLRPGSTFGGSSSPSLRAPAQPPVADPRQARLTAVCDKLEAELRASPRMREFLGGSEQTIATLRRTCEDLARRERELRDESDATRLGEERAGLEKRIAQERDELTANSLRGALTAIDGQKRQREILGVRAERLDAEQTRLLYTLEGLASQFVRLRTSGGQPAPAELEFSVAQLSAELDAISDALDDVAGQAPSHRLRELAQSPASADTAATPTVRARSRE
jgi:carbonic anhydrase/acetyltransferase-like protein (isoleucine patch superfamily)